MPKMRIGWYAGISTALAGAVVISAFHQRANFYSAMVYLAQSNFCLLVIVNFTFLLYSSFIYGLTRICYGSLRAIEVEQLTERAWFAITETCLAMTTFREEIGAWFLVMFTALVTGKVWGWIGDGRVEFLEQQPPANPRLFHIRLSISLALSFVYDIWILRYTINSVIQQARPNMMVMFLFEFAVLATCSWRTGARYILSIAEQKIIQAQTQKRLAERKSEIREQREAIIRERERAAAAGEDTPEDQAPLPDEDDIDEMDIEVPGWAAKGEWVLWLDLLTDMIKLGIYVAFFLMLFMFIGLPIHIMRDLFMTTRDFLKRLHALLRYRRAIQEMNKYPDATVQELAQENTCIICREDMSPWDPANNSSTIDRVRPKKLPCGHILHLGCLKSWLERQQVCPTCRSPVTMDRARTPDQRAAGLRIQFGGAPQQPQEQRPGVNNGDANNDNNNNNAQGRQNNAPPQAAGGPRVFNFGPIRFGFGANGQQARELAHQFGIPQLGAPQGHPNGALPPQNQTPATPTGDSIQNIGSLLHQAEQMIQRELQNLQSTQQELQTAYLLTSELHRLRQRRQQPHDASQGTQGNPTTPMSLNQSMTLPLPHMQQFQIPIQAQFPQLAGLPSFSQPLSGIPPRLNSPLMARHGAPGYTTTIPAGSPDLPEGVVLPPGWSLMPLQRLDGAQPSAQPSPQGSVPPQQADGLNANQHGAVASSSNQPSTSGQGSQETHNAVEQALPTPTNVETLRQRQMGLPRPPQHVGSPPMVSPSPVVPNWGGSAQLFNGGSRLGQTETMAQSTLPGEVAGDGYRGRSEVAVQPRSESESGYEQIELGDARPEQSDRGKGKVVTIEETEDDDSS